MGQAVSRPDATGPRLFAVHGLLPPTRGLELESGFLQDATDGAEASVLSPSIFVAKSWGVGASGFLVFEYIMSVGEGLRLFGTSRLTSASVLYLANFIFPLITSLVTLIIGFSRVSDEVCCGVVAHINAIFGLLQYLPWAAFFGMRAYALAKHLPMALLILMLALVPFGTNLVQFDLGLTSVNAPTIGCLVGVDIPKELAMKCVFMFTTCGHDAKNLYHFDTVMIASRTCVIATHALLLAITWYTIPRRHRGTPGGTTPNLAGLLLQDGTMYLISLLVLNAVDLAVHLVANSEVEAVNYIVAFYEPLTAVLISRFLLDLHAAHRKVQTLNSRSVLLDGEKSQASDRILGSLGASIAPGWLSYKNTATATTSSDVEKERDVSSAMEVEIPQV